MPGYRILIIQENPKDRIEYTRLFEGLGFLVDTLPDGSMAQEHCLEHKPEMVLADMAAPNFDSFAFLQMISAADINSQVVFLSSDPGVEDAVKLMKQGALDYLVKPVSMDHLAFCAKSVMSMKTRSMPDTRQLKQGPPVTIITCDSRMERLLHLAGRIADSSASVLIQGESGTGKELFARYIHENSGRKDRAFVAINCAALPENLLESELFGHEKGAFTGAMSGKAGKFELAHSGTLLLDEITEMQFHLQAKLLRVLQEKKVDRVGGTSPVDVDVRVIATTNQDVATAIESGCLRQDLYYRLNTIPLMVPPLRDRPGDLKPLITHFIDKYCKIDRRHVKGLTKEACAMLKTHQFTGNIRELENIIHRAVLLCEGGQIRPEDLLLDMSEQDKTGMLSSFDAPDTSLEPSSLKEMEQKMIYAALDQTEGNRTHAAKILGVSVRTLRNKLNEYKEQSPS